MKLSTLVQKLQTEWDRRKGHNASYSLRSLARDVGAPVSTLSRVLRGQREPGSALLHAIELFLEQPPAGNESNEPAAAKSKRGRVKITGLKDSDLFPLENLLDFVILGLGARKDRSQNIATIAAMLAVTPSEIEQSLTRLKNAGLLRLNLKGEWRVSPDKLFSYSPTSEDRLRFHKQAAARVLAFLSETKPSEIGDFHSATIELSKSGLAEAQNILKDALQKILRESKRNVGKADETYVLHMGLAPYRGKGKA